MSQVDPEVWSYLKEIADGPSPSLSALSVDGARQMMDRMYSPIEGEPVGRVDDLQVPGATDGTDVRIYTPEGEGPFPALVFFHGGGWVLGSIDTHDALCRGLTNQVDCVVVSVDYNRAPEHPFPEPLEDCYLATKWVADNARAIDVDADRIAVGGDSAGGNLAAAVSLLARDRGGPPLVHQLIAYPVMVREADTAAFEENPGIMFSEDDIRWCWEKYLPHETDARNPYATPLEERDLSGVPPATVLTGDLDPLRDDGRMYADRLNEDGVPVEYANYEGMTHSFIQFEGVESALAGREKTTERLREAFEV